MFNKKYIMVSVIKELGGFSINKMKVFKPSENSKTIIEGITIDTDNPTISKRLKIYFYFNKGKQLSFIKGKPNNYDKGVVDDMLCKGIISEFTKAISRKNTKQKIFDLIIGSLFGGLITFIISAFVFGGFTI